MASLETLTLEISGSAAQASGNIGSLITSLGNLGNAVRNEIPSLRELAQLLGQIKSSSGILNFGKGLNVSAIKSATNATKEMNSEMAKTKQIMKSGSSVMPGTDAFGRPLDKNVPLIMQNGQTFGPEINGVRELQKEAEKATTTVNNLKQAVRETGAGGGNGLGSSHSAREMRMMARGNGVSVGEIADRDAARNVQEVNSAIEQTAPAANSAATAIGTFNNAQQQMGAEANNAAKAVSREYKDTYKEVSKASFGLARQIGRIAKTMLIRTALKAVFKMAKEGLENYYQYSKTIAGDYAATADKLKDATNTAGNQVGAAIASLINAAAPALMTLLDIVAKLAEALTMIFSLLSGKTTYSKAKEGFGSIASAAGGASAAMKELLAQFDELNVIAQEGGGGGGGGAGGNYGEMFEEVDLPQWMIDYKWLIELVAYAGLAFLALKKLFDLLNMFKMLKNPFGGIGFGTDIKFPTQPNYKPFPPQPDYKPFPVQPPYNEFPAEPDYKNALVQMLAISAAIKAASADMDMLNRKAQLFAITLASIKDKTVKVKLDTRAFEPKRRDVDDWMYRLGEKTIRVDLDLYDYLSKKDRIDSWSHSTDTKHIRLDVDMNRFNGAVNEVRRWTNEVPVKKIDISFPSWSDFINRANIVNKWVSEKATKYIDIVFRNWNDFKAKVREIDDWVNKHVYKQVTVVINFVAGSLPNLKDLTEDFAKMKMPDFGSNQISYSSGAKSQYDTSGRGDGGTHGATSAYNFGLGTPIYKELGDLLPDDWLHADGGLISNGDLFIANERGAELVGSFGNSTGVANNDMIIEGISRGVSDANAEQNALLRQQNELLRDILNKDSSVRINASAAFGRVASQSLAMYGAMTGG